MGMIAQDLTAAIEAAAEPKSPNRLSAERLRELVRDYLSRRQERLADRPDRLREDHYTFWAADWDPEGEHMFAFAVFVGESVTIAVGRGQVPDVVRFIELEFDGTGFGNRTLAAVCESVGIDTSLALEKLKSAGIDITVNETLKKAADTHGLSPIDLLKIILVNGYKP